MFERTQRFIQWLSYKLVNRRGGVLFYRLYHWYTKIENKIQSWGRFSKDKNMIKLAIVGDLSMQDPARLDKVMKAALVHADLVFNVGDVHPGYEVMRKHLATGKVWIVPGNHDEDYDSMHTPRQWILENDFFVAVGLDNSEDSLNNESWMLLEEAEKITKDNYKCLFVVLHKPISTVILPNGLEDHHIMGREHKRDASVVNTDVEKLIKYLDKQENVLLICGHYHQFSFQRNWYCDVLIDGRGGASADIGYSLLLVHDKGWTFNKIDL